MRTTSADHEPTQSNDREPVAPDSGGREPVAAAPAALDLAAGEAVIPGSAARQPVASDPAAPDPAACEAAAPSSAARAPVAFAPAVREPVASDPAAPAPAAHESVIRDLGTRAHRLHHPPGTSCACDEPQLLVDRPDGTVVRSGPVVGKAHAADADRVALAARLALASAPQLTGILLPPLTTTSASLTTTSAPLTTTSAPLTTTSAPLTTTSASLTTTSAPLTTTSAPLTTTSAPLTTTSAPLTTTSAPLTTTSAPLTTTSASLTTTSAPLTTTGTPGTAGTAPRPVSFWPYGVPVDPTDPDAAPWAEAAVLLARLHRTPPPHPLPPMRGPLKAARAVARMCAALPGDGAVLPVRAAWQALPAWVRGEAAPPAGRARFLCHGDLHLGQLVRHPAPHGPWLLIDMDDAGEGDPAWDLARPAAWFAAGVLAPDDWLLFLDAYRSAGGPAVPSAADGDPWPQLDVPARALTVQTAAVALAKCAVEGREPDEMEQLMIDSCARIATLPPELAAGRAS